MKLALVFWLCCTTAFGAGPKADADCTKEIEKYKVVLQDYRVQVGLLEQKADILKAQRDEAVKSQGGIPLNWLLTGVLAGAIVGVYLRR